MIPSTQEVLVLRRDAAVPELMPWGNFYLAHKHDPQLLRQVEARLLAFERWENDQGLGPEEILRITMSAIWCQ